MTGIAVDFTHYPTTYYSHTEHSLIFPFTPPNVFIQVHSIGHLHTHYTHFCFEAYPFHFCTSSRSRSNSTV